MRGASGGTVLYGAFATDYTASRDIVSNEAASSNLDMYHISAGAAFNVKGNRFSLGIERAYGGRMRDFSFGGLPSSVPIIGGSQPVEVRYSRWVLALGYQFNRSN